MAKDDEYGFFDDVRVDEDGNVLVQLVTRSGRSIKPGSQFEFFDEVRLTDDGYIMIVVK